MSSFRKHVETIQMNMANRSSIRNISVIAHVDHGKTTLTDSLLGAAGIISAKAVGNKLFTHSRPDEAEKGITIKSTSISLPFEVKGEQVLVNLIDSPGHVDFSSEVTAALRVTDGALLVVDVVEGCGTQTETVLRQALSEKIRPVLFLNKIDRAIVELQYTPEELYVQLLRIIENVNVLLATYAEEDSEPIVLDPALGNVAFGAGKMGFGFTLSKFADMYASKVNVTSEKMRPRLWGTNYYDSVNKKWLQQPSSNATKRGFCQFVLEPIYKLFSTCNDANCSQEVMWTELDKILPALNIKLSSDDRKLGHKETLKTVMQHFLPAHEALLEMIVEHLPSPLQAQSYRCPLLYTGPQDDVYAQAIKNCDPDGPLIIFVSKMVPMADGSRFIAFGRVFSGTVHGGQKVKILANDEDVFHAPIHKTLLMMGKNTESIEQVKAGNVCGLVGIDKFIIKSCTVTQDNAKDVFPIRGMKYSVSPVVQVAVEPENPADMVKLVEGLKKMSKSDPLVQVLKSDSGQFVVAGAGELHLDIILSDLENEYCKGAKLKRSNPVVQFCETIVGKSQPCLAKSANKLNRLFFEAEPLNDELTLAIEQNKVDLKDVKNMAKILKEDYGWSAVDAKKIWCFSAETGSNTLVDTSKGVDYMLDIQGDVVSSFKWASKHGVLCEEPLRGVRFNIIDAMIHADAPHRGSGQILPAAKRAISGAQLCAEPRIVEPMYLVEVQTTNQHMGAVYNVINKRRGTVVGSEVIQGTPLVIIKAHLPVLESFGLTEQLRGATGGNAFPQCSFDHWQVLANQDPRDQSSRAHSIVNSVRTRKGLKLEIPNLYELVDKL